MGGKNIRIMQLMRWLTNTTLDQEFTLNMARTRSLFPHSCHLLRMAFSSGRPSFNTRIFWSLTGGLLGFATRKYPFSVEIQALLYSSYPLKSSKIMAANRSAKSGASVFVHVPSIPFPVIRSHESKEFVLKINQWDYKGMKINDANLSG